jgi:hypothetical protein
MSSGALSRLLLWIALVIFCTIAMVDLPFAYQVLPVIGHITYFDVLLAASLCFGSATLMRVAGNPEPSRGRTMCRILIAYLLFELLIVIPIALWLGAATLNAILGAAAIRFTWLLFPVVLVLCADARIRRLTGGAAVVAAVCLGIWGLYSAATGGGTYYYDLGDVRWRVLALGGGGLLLFAWPFVLAMSQAIPRRYAPVLIGVSVVGLLLTNSRSGLISFAIAGLACVVMAGQTGRAIAWIAPVALIVVVAGLMWGQQSTGVFTYTLSHLVDVGSGNGAERVMRWRLAWDYFASRPFNDFVWSWRYYLVYLQRDYQPHNFALGVAVTEGVAGLIFYGSILATSLRGAWRWGQKDAEARALVGYLIAYLAFSLANANWYQPPSIVLLVAAVAGLTARMDHLGAAERSRLSAAEVPA